MSYGRNNEHNDGSASRKTGHELLQEWNHDHREDDLIGNLNGSSIFDIDEELNTDFDGMDNERVAKDNAARFPTPICALSDTADDPVKSLSINGKENTCQESVEIFSIEEEQHEEINPGENCPAPPQTVEMAEVKDDTEHIEAELLLHPDQQNEESVCDEKTEPVEAAREEQRELSVLQLPIEEDLEQATPAQEAEIPDDKVPDVDKKMNEFEDEEMAEEVQDDESEEVQRQSDGAEFDDASGRENNDKDLPDFDEDEEMPEALLTSIEDGLDEMSSNDLVTLSLKQIKAKLKTMIGLEDGTILEWKKQINEVIKRRGNMIAQPDKNTSLEQKASPDAARSPKAAAMSDSSEYEDSDASDAEADGHEVSSRQKKENDSNAKKRETAKTNKVAQEELKVRNIGVAWFWGGLLFLCHFRLFFIGAR